MHHIDISIDLFGDVVVSTYRKDGTIISKGHGHVIHAGDVGIAQAASYATKRMYFNMKGENEND